MSQKVMFTVEMSSRWGSQACSEAQVALLDEKVRAGSLGSWWRSRDWRRRAWPCSHLWGGHSRQREHQGNPRGRRIPGTIKEERGTREVGVEGWGRSRRKWKLGGHCPPWPVLGGLVSSKGIFAFPLRDRRARNREAQSRDLVRLQNCARKQRRGQGQLGRWHLPTCQWLPHTAVSVTWLTS